MVGDFHMIQCIIHVADRLDTEKIGTGRCEHHKMPEKSGCLDRQHRAGQGPGDIRPAAPVGETIIECRAAYGQPAMMVPGFRQGNQLVWQHVGVVGPDAVGGKMEDWPMPRWKKRMQPKPSRCGSMIEILDFEKDMKRICG